MEKEQVPFVPEFYRRNMKIRWKKIPENRAIGTKGSKTSSPVFRAIGTKGSRIFGPVFRAIGTKELKQDRAYIQTYQQNR